MEPEGHGLQTNEFLVMQAGVESEESEDGWFLVPGFSELDMSLDKQYLAAKIQNLQVSDGKPFRNECPNCNPNPI